MTMHENEDELDSDPEETEPLKLERAVSISRELIVELQRRHSHQRLFANQSKDHLVSRRRTAINKLMEIDTEEPDIFTVDDVADLLEQLLAEQEHVEQQKTDIRALLTIFLVVVLSFFVYEYPLFSLQIWRHAEHTKYDWEYSTRNTALRMRNKILKTPLAS